MDGLGGLMPTVLPWIQAFIWAFKPTDVIDIRRFPADVAAGTESEIARLEGKPKPAAEEATTPPETS